MIAKLNLDIVIDLELLRKQREELIKLPEDSILGNFVNLIDFIQETALKKYSKKDIYGCDE